MKTSKKSNNTKKIALSAIFSAMGVVIMFAGCVTGVLDLSSVALASFLVFAAVIEIDGAYPYLIWICTSILALIFLPDKFIALEYLLFGGIYPILKRYFEQYHPIVAWLFKLSYFNTMILIAYIIGKFVMHLPDEAGVELSILFFGAGNVFFLLYDYASSAIITLYLMKIRKRLKLENFFKK